MKVCFFTVLMTLTTSLMARTNMNLEGSCRGKLHDKTPMEFTYYSDFDGCKEKINAGITFSRSQMGQGMSTGDRRFTETQDIYTFKSTKLTFKNSTGNTSGKLTYKDDNGRSRTVTVNCSIRNYEYAPCE